MIPTERRELLKVQTLLIDKCDDVADVVFCDLPPSTELSIITPCDKGLFVYLVDDIKQYNFTVRMYHVMDNGTPLVKFQTYFDPRYSISYLFTSVEALLGRVNKIRP